LSALETYKGEQVVKAFQKSGWRISRQRGSPIILEKDSVEATLSIPVHKGKDIKRGTLRNLIHDAGMNAEEFLENN
jgi:predicted RNA binding protein YcfA (HicA-like mRNA interferase family)